MIDTEEAICLAVQLRAGKQKTSSSDVINSILRKALAAELAEVSGLPPLLAVIQNFYERFRSPQAIGSRLSIANQA